MTKSLHLILLGDLQITLDGEPVFGFNSNKAKALLCYLAVTKRTHLRRRLLGLLWGDMPETQAMANLRVTLSHLRRHFGPYLTITRQTVAFNPESPHRLDVADFSAYLDPAGTEPQIAQLRQGVKLYRGDFLAGFYVRQAPDFEEWTLLERERLRELALQALHALAAHHANLGEIGYPAAIDYANRLLALDPWREGAHRQLMLLLARSGQWSAALAQYETCRQLLSAELGVEPSPATAALYERLKAARSGKRHNLPPQPTTFVGREQELAQINNRLANRACRLLTLVGPGGIGKTRLALQAAAQQTGRFLEGVYFFSLASLHSAGFLVSSIAATLQVSFYGGEAPKEQLLNYLREKEVLLILDNFEHLLEGTALLVDILQQAPQVKLLVTSRERLNMAGEWLLEIEGLPFPIIDRLQLKEAHDVAALVEAYSAAHLFVQSASRIQPDFVLSTAEGASVARICRLVEGMPLGIELAATWVRTLSCREIVQEIERNLSFLTTSWRDVPERHRSLRAVFNHSWQRLSDVERSVFRKLSVFRGGFSREAAEKVSGATLLTLSALVDKSFLRRSPGGRYERHTLLWQYAAEELAQNMAEKEQVQSAHCDYYVAFLRHREAGLLGQKQKQTLEQLGQEIENIHSAWDWATDQRRYAAIEQAWPALYKFYDMRSWFQEGRVLFGAAVKRLLEAPLKGAAQQLLIAKLQARQGALCCRFGLYEEAQELLGKSLAVFRRHGIDSEIAFCLYFLGYTIHELGEPMKAQDPYLESLAISQRLDDQAGEARVLNVLGIVAFEVGEYRLARQYYRECLEIYQAIDDQTGIARTFSNMGNVAYMLKAFTEARQLFQQSLLVHRELGNRFYESIALTNLGAVTIDLEAYQEAEGLLRESLTICRELGDLWGVALALNNLGNIAKIQGDYQKAKQYYFEGLAKAMIIGVTPVALEVLVELVALLPKEERIELLALIDHHPTCYEHIRNEAKRLLADLEAEFPADVVADARRRGEAKSLEEVVSELLGSSWRLGV